MQPLLPLGRMSMGMPLCYLSFVKCLFFLLLKKMERTSKRSQVNTKRNKAWGEWNRPPKKRRKRKRFLPLCCQAGHAESSYNNGLNTKDYICTLMIDVFLYNNSHPSPILQHRFCQHQSSPLASTPDQSDLSHQTYTAPEGWRKRWNVEEEGRKRREKGEDKKKYGQVKNSGEKS